MTKTPQLPAKENRGYNSANGHMTKTPQLPATENRGNNSGNLKGIITKTELDVCIMLKTLCKNSKNIWARKKKI